MARVESSILIDAAPGLIRSHTDDLASCAEHTGGRLTLILQDNVAVTGSTLKGALDLGDSPIAFAARVTEAGVERLAWETTESKVPLRGEIAAKQTPEGTRLVFALETGQIGGMPGSRAEREAVRRLQDLSDDYVNAVRDAVVKAPIDLSTQDRIGV